MNEAVDTMPSPEFHRSFPIGRTIFVSNFRMRSVIPIRVDPIKARRNIIQSQQSYENCLLCLRGSCQLLANCCSRLRTELKISNIQSEKQQQRDDDLRCPPSMLTACEFALHGVRNSRFSIFHVCVLYVISLTSMLCNYPP